MEVCLFGRSKHEKQRYGEARIRPRARPTYLSLLLTFISFIGMSLRPRQAHVISKRTASTRDGQRMHETWTQTSGIIYMRSASFFLLCTSFDPTPAYDHIWWSVFTLPSPDRTHLSHDPGHFKLLRVYAQSFHLGTRHPHIGWVSAYREAPSPQPSEQFLASRVEGGAEDSSARAACDPRFHLSAFLIYD